MTSFVQQSGNLISWLGHMFELKGHPMALLMLAAVEHLACGAGLVNIYNFLREENPSGRSAEQLQTERDPPSIGKAAMAVSCLPQACFSPSLLFSKHVAVT